MWDMFLKDEIIYAWGEKHKERRWGSLKLLESSKRKYIKTFLVKY